MNAFFRTDVRIVSFALTACVALLPAPASAQTWRWQLVDHQADQPAHETRSAVVLSARDVSMSYSLLVNESVVPVASCQGSINDVAHARIIPGRDSPFLYVAFKPGHAARCNAGRQAVALIPVASDAAAQSAIDAINRAASTTLPIPSATPAPPRPQRATSAPLVSPVVDDWVEGDGLFAFIRVRDDGVQPVTIVNGFVENCRAVIAGCGPIRRTMRIAPGATGTLAAVMSRDASNAAAFTYRYQAGAGTTTAGEAGNWRKRPSSAVPPLTNDEIRLAESVAVSDLTVHPAVAPRSGPVIADRHAQLTGRGSSRLAIGHKGSAMVRVKISAAGVPLEARIVRISDRALAPAAIETAVTSTYAPAIASGRPAESEYVVEFEFNGEDPSLSGIPVWKRAPLSGSSPSANALPASGPAIKAAAVETSTPVPAPGSANTPAPH